MIWRFKRFQLWFCSRVSIVFAMFAGLPGIKFAFFGLSCARKCRREGLIDIAWGLSITPVSCVRYFEFGFAERILSAGIDGRCLDVSSPRLLGAYILERHRKATIDFINPDKPDLQETERLINAVHPGINRCSFHNIYANKLPWPDETFDCIWSISVIEHIPEPQDVNTIKELWRVLKPNGKLILTLPACNSSWDEYKENNVYNLSLYKRENHGKYFFQRWYDQKILDERIFSVIPECKLVGMEVWGETKKGWFCEYAKGLEKKGMSISCRDPILMRTKFQRYNSVDELAWEGIINLYMQKG